MLTGMAGWVRQLAGLMEGIVLRDAASRVARYLIETGGDQEPKVQLPGRKRDIASHLNMTSESLSRALRHLREIGLGWRGSFRSCSPGPSEPGDHEAHANRHTRAGARR